MQNKPLIPILMAEDDEEDQLLSQKAFQKAELQCDLKFVSNGEELMDYLYQRGIFSDTRNYPHPGLILLDLNMPKKDGREALAEIKSDPNLKQIPIVILTTSDSHDDVNRVYRLGANSFITKPPSLKGMVDVMKSIKQYWLTTVKLPNYSDYFI